LVRPVATGRELAAWTIPFQAHAESPLSVNRLWALSVGRWALRFEAQPQNDAALPFPTLLCNIRTMKIVLIVCLAIAWSSVAVGQDPDMDEQIKQAQEAAKGMGVKMPDMQKLMEESAKEDAADEEAAKGEANSNKSPSPASSPTAAPVVVNIPAGTAQGSLMFDGVKSELKFAAAFVDQKDERKPVVLVVSDEKLPTEKWSSEFDMMRHQSKWSGVVFFLDNEGTVYRSDVHTKGRQASVSGIFDLKVNDPKGKDLAGMAKTESSSKDDKLDVTFHATRK